MTSSIYFPEDGAFRTEQEFREGHPNVSFPEVLTPETLAEYGGVFVVPTPQPAYDPISHAVREGAPVLAAGHWEQAWEIFALDALTVAANKAAQAQRDADAVADKIEQLWAAATAYERQFISGVAVGLLTIGVVQQKPKALAVSAWSGAHWDEYYARKAAVTATSEVNLDFASSGQMPFSVPELRAELGL